MAGTYETSVDFTNDLLTLFNNLQEAAAILAKPEFAEWLKITDTNYGTDTHDSGLALNKLVISAVRQADVLDAEITKADES